MDLFRRDRPRRRRSGQRRDRHGRERRRKIPRARRVFAGVADSRARLDVRSGAGDRCAVPAAAGFARRPRARVGVARRSATRHAASCTASRTAFPASSPIATATRSSSSCSSAGAGSAGARRSSRRLRRSTGVACVYERSDVEVRALEGLAAAHRRHARSAAARRDDRARTASPTGSTSSRGQKTGFYLDQRDNRAIVRALAAGRACSTSSATPADSRSRRSPGGARERAVDRQRRRRAGARARATSRATRRCRQPARHGSEADVFVELRRLRDAGARFDLIVLDPPKFAPDRGARRARRARLQGHQPARVEAAARTDGLLATFSCSAAIDAKLFAKIVAGAALDARDRRDHRPALRGQRRPPGHARVSRGRVPQGTADPKELAARRGWTIGRSTLAKRGERPAGAAARSEGRDST